MNTLKGILLFLALGSSWSNSATGSPKGGITLNAFGGELFFQGNYKIEVGSVKRHVIEINNFDSKRTNSVSDTIIRAGAVSSAEKKQFSSSQRKYKCYSFDIGVYELSTGDGVITLTVFLDDESYVSISSSDSYLWRNSLKEFNSGKSGECKL